MIPKVGDKFHKYDDASCVVEVVSVRPCSCGEVAPSRGVMFALRGNVRLRRGCYRHRTITPRSRCLSCHEQHTCGAAVIRWEARRVCRDTPTCDYPCEEHIE